MVNFKIDNSISGKKISYIVLMFLIIVLLFWFTVNAELDLQSRASWYAIIGIGAILAFSLDAIFERFGLLEGIKKRTPNETDIIETISFEKLSFLFGEIKGVKLFGLIVISLAILIFTIINVTTTGYSIVGAPSQIFQVAQTGLAGDVITTIAFAIIENILFFGVLMPTFFGISYYLIDRLTAGSSISPWIAFVLSIFIITPMVFTLFHFNAYGPTNLSGTQSVYIFGVTGGFFTFILRNQFITDALHVGNNLGTLLSETTRIGFAISGGGG